MLQDELLKPLLEKFFVILSFSSKDSIGKYTGKEQTSEKFV